MATSRDPNQPTHKIFANQHNPGQKTTKHRSVETARQAVNKEGAHPQKGNFSRQQGDLQTSPVDPSTPPKPPSPDYVAKYSAPDGSGVAVTYHGANTGETASMDPHDKQVSVNDRKFSQPAARAYAQERFGIPVHNL